jgi:two-component system, NarL family, nitrate/nitrite response regulator NarL
MSKPIRLMIADDHSMFRDGLRKLIETQPDLVLVGEASDGIEAVERARELKPDVLTLDLSMPQMSGLEVVAELARMPSSVRTIMLVASIDRAGTITALQNGARGIVLKESATELLFKAIRCVMAGQYWVGRDTVSDLVQTLGRLSNASAASSRNKFGLTRRELEVLAFVVDGLTNKEIADKGGLSADTIKHHLTSIFDKTGASNRLELALFAIHHQLVSSAGGVSPALQKGAKAI